MRALPDEEIDTEEMSEITDWSGAKRGVFYRPVKQQITLRLDADLIDWFKRHHPEGRLPNEHKPGATGIHTAVLA